MVSVPSFLLKKLYVKNSLKNTENGFQFELKNVLAEATIISGIKIYLNDKPIDQKNISLSVRDSSIKSEDINIGNSIKFSVGNSVIVKVTDKPLTPSQYKIDIKTESKEFGEIAFSVQDSVA